MLQILRLPLQRAVLLQLLVALLIGLPVGAAIWFGFVGGGGQTWTHILENRLFPYTATTLTLLAITGIIICVIAVPLAWIISLYDFPLRNTLEWALILPLAVPGYVLAYAWVDLAGVSGPVQSLIRDLSDLRARDYWFPDIVSVPGLAFILASALFPYVYITARAAFTTQSQATLEAGRSLGASGFRLFSAVGVPAARPAIFAGLALALMETAADYGAADYLGIQTLGVGIVRAWTSFGEPGTAARLAVVLIAIAFACLIFARLSQGGAGAQHTSYRWTSPKRTRLEGRAARLATASCLLVLIISFGLPLLRLIWLNLEHNLPVTRLLDPLYSSLILAAAGTLAAFLCAATLVLSSHYARQGGWFIRFAAAAGYAAPGVVLGLGGLFMMQTTGQALSGVFALVLLVWIYTSRFASAGTEPLQAALARAPASIDQAARSLNVTGWSRLIRVDIPLLSPGALAAALILFVEILKELPATLMLRPFGWDTLAVRAHAYASDERLAQATTPALLIVLAGLVPVFYLSRQLTRSGQALS
ncbi:MAG: iron ABC transporter permease [Pseudomonadota bacterium]